MLTNFFGKSKPINTIIILLMLLSAYLLAVFNKKLMFNWQVFPLFLFLFVLINFINIKNRLTFDNSYMFLFFTLLMSFFYQTIKIGDIFYENLILLLFFRKVYSLQSPKKVYKKLFDAGFWLGVLFIINSNLIIFVLFLYLSVFFYGRVSVRALLIPIISFSSPIFLYFTYCFLTNTLDNFDTIFKWIFINDFSFYKQYNFLYIIGFVGFFILLSVFLKTPKIIAIKSSFQPTWILILAHFIIAQLVVMFTIHKDGSEFLYVLFPTAIILANGFELIKRKWIADIVLMFFVIFAFTFLFL